jgi:hypothetical protein
MLWTLIQSARYAGDGVMVEVCSGIPPQPASSSPASVASSQQQRQEKLVKACNCQQEDANKSVLLIWDRSTSGTQPRMSLASGPREFSEAEILSAPGAKIAVRCAWGRTAAPSRSCCYAGNFMWTTRVACV